jgi:hypothetical protein
MDQIQQMIQDLQKDFPRHDTLRPLHDRQAKAPFTSELTPDSIQQLLGQLRDHNADQLHRYITNLSHDRKESVGHLLSMHLEELQRQPQDALVPRLEGPDDTAPSRRTIARITNAQKNLIDTLLDHIAGDSFDQLTSHQKGDLITRLSGLLEDHKNRKGQDHLTPQQRYFINLLNIHQKRKEIEQRIIQELEGIQKSHFDSLLRKCLSEKRNTQHLTQENSNASKDRKAMKAAYSQKNILATSDTNNKVTNKRNKNLSDARKSRREGIPLTDEQKRILSPADESSRKQKQKRSDARKARRDGIPLTDEQKRILAPADAWRRKLSDARKARRDGIPLTDEQKRMLAPADAWIREWNKNLSDARKACRDGILLTDEQKRILACADSYKKKCLKKLFEANKSLKDGIPLTDEQKKEY